MKVLLDECVPHRLRNHLPQHECQTARRAGFGELENAELRQPEAVSWIVVPENSVRLQNEQDTGRLCHMLHGRILVRTLRKGRWVSREDGVRNYCEGPPSNEFSGGTVSPGLSDSGRLLTITSELPTNRPAGGVIRGRERYGDIQQLTARLAEPFPEESVGIVMKGVPFAIGRDVREQNGEGRLIFG